LKNEKAGKMRKHGTLVLLICFAVFGPGAGASRSQSAKPAAARNSVQLAESPRPAPAKVKPGLDAITAEGSLGMLSYLASDLLEGRETGTRGYQLAAEYAASLFSLWQLKPAGGASEPDRTPAGSPSHRESRRWLLRGDTRRSSS
jgi:hypothetical protein